MSYDIEKAFARIEEELLLSMIKNMRNHRAWEDDEKIQWEQWQAMQLEALQEYKKRNQERFSQEFKEINQLIVETIYLARETGNMEQEIEILERVKKGQLKKPQQTKREKEVIAEFFKINDRKMEALVKATISDMEKAETAILRMADDKYRQIIFQAQAYANSGAGTYEKAVDMAVKDYTAAGLNCVEYKNGARHTLQDYADMALRTASKRAYLTGEGEKRKEWGISTVIMNKRGNPCPKCLPWVGKVIIDDVWSGGSREDGNYPLMSEAIAAGLYHPRCKDSHNTYLEGISTPPGDKFTKDEIEHIENDYSLQQKMNVAKKNYERYDRLEKTSLDAKNKESYSLRKEQWKQKYTRYYKQYNTSSNKIKMKKYSRAAQNITDAEEWKALMSYGENSSSRDSRQNAATVKEAEEYAAQFLSEYATYGISYEGMSIQSANAVNKAITKIYDKYKVSKLNGIRVPQAGDEFDGILGSAPAAISPQYRLLLLNRDYFKKVEDPILDKQARERINIKKNLQNETKGKLIEASAISGRLTVPQSIEDAINHEFGHIFESAIEKKENYKTIVKNMPIYAEKISGYATTDISEYIAESFASYRMGEEIIDPELKKAFRLLEKNRM